MNNFLSEWLHKIFENIDIGVTRISPVQDISLKQQMNSHTYNLTCADIWLVLTAILMAGLHFSHLNTIPARQPWDQNIVKQRILNIFKIYRRNLQYKTMAIILYSFVKEPNGYKW